MTFVVSEDTEMAAVPKTMEKLEGTNRFLIWSVASFRKLLF
jgi:hypothetical protein